MDHYPHGHPCHLPPVLAESRVAYLPESPVYHSLSTSVVPHPTRHTSCAPTMDVPVDLPRRGCREYAGWQAMQNPNPEKYIPPHCGKRHGSSLVLDRHHYKSTSHRLCYHHPSKRQTPVHAVHHADYRPVALLAFHHLVVADAHNSH